MRHLTVQQISGSLDGALSGVSLELVVRHLASCHECRERHARLTKQDDGLRRLLACDFPDVMFDDMFARLGVVLEAESRGQIPPEHALPPELPPLEPEPQPSREMPRPASSQLRIPALPDEAEQKRRAAAELKAAEAAAMQSLEDLFRDLNTKKTVAMPRPEPAAPPTPALTPEPAPPTASAAPAPPPALAAPAAPPAPAAPVAKAPVPPPAPPPSHPPAPPEPVASDEAAEVAPPEPEVAQPRSILVLPPELLASLREAGPDRAARGAQGDAPREAEVLPMPGRAGEPLPEPVESQALDAEPEGVAMPEALAEAEAVATPEPVFEPEPIAVSEPVAEPEPIAPEPVEVVEIEETSLTWVVVDGPLPAGPDLAHAVPEPHEPQPVAEAPAFARPEEPQPVAYEPPVPFAPPPPVAPTPAVPHAAPAPPRHREEPPAVPHVAPAVRHTASPPPRPRDEAPAKKAPKVRPPILDATPDSDPYADYEMRLEAERQEQRRIARARLPRGRHIAIAAGALVGLLALLGVLAYLPPVIRVPVPELPKPRMPRIEVVKVPIAPAPAPEPKPHAAATATVAKPARPQPHATTPTAPPVTAPRRQEPVAASAAPTRSPEVARPSAPVSKPAEVPAHHTEAPPVARETHAPPAPRPDPVQAPVRPAPTSVPAPAAATTPADEGADDSARWPLLCGVVVDDAGSPVAGARVALADLDLGARTDRRGHFCIAAPPGDRTLSVVAAGFATHRRIVSLGSQNLEISIALTPAP